MQPAPDLKSVAVAGPAQTEAADDGHAVFGAALLNSAHTEPDGVVGPDGQPAPKRFNVYRNNVVASLLDFLAGRFPAVQRLVGEAYFRALAKEYVVTNPPKSPVLLWYGAGFAGFVAAFPPLRSYPYLADVARAEMAWAEGYHAADAPALDPAVLGQIPPENLAEVVFNRHPSAQTVSSDYPVYELLAANRFDIDSKRNVDLSTRQSVLVVRPELDVMVHLIGKGEEQLLRSLMEGRPLGEAAASALAASPELDLSACLGAFLSWGCFTDFQELS